MVTGDITNGKDPVTYLPAASLGKGYVGLFNWDSVTYVNVSHPLAQSTPQTYALWGCCAGASTSAQAATTVSI